MVACLPPHHEPASLGVSLCLNRCLNLPTLAVWVIELSLQGGLLVPGRGKDTELELAGGLWLVNLSLGCKGGLRVTGTKWQPKKYWAFLQFPETVSFGCFVKPLLPGVCLIEILRNVGQPLNTPN